jgi:hypothetical protein
LMGFTYGPLGTFLSVFPTNIRYSGTSLAFNMAGIIRQLLRLWLRFGWRLIIVWPTLVLSDFRSLYLFVFFVSSSKRNKF